MDANEHFPEDEKQALRMAKEFFTDESIQGEGTPYPDVYIRRKNGVPFCYRPIRIGQPIVQAIYMCVEMADELINPDVPPDLTKEEEECPLPEQNSNG